MTIPRAWSAAVLAALVFVPPAHAQDVRRIDRHALVTRHNPTLTRVDPASPLMVGNGNLAFTADITGLQTFQDQYSPRVPLMIQSQWAWHSVPNPAGYTIARAEKAIDVRGQARPYAWLESWDEARDPAIQWLRENPHRFSLGRIGLHLVKADGSRAAFADLSDTRQTLDLWTGRLESRFVFDGAPVEVETSVHPTLDAVIVRLKSPLLASRRLGIDLAFPGVSKQLNPDPADWTHPEAHRTSVFDRHLQRMQLERRIDDTCYYVDLVADRAVETRDTGPHAFRITAREGESLVLVVAFAERPSDDRPQSGEAAREAVAAWWQRHWTDGGVVDFSGSTDPRAKELERRVVLSQYLTAVNGAGVWPPQEEGLFSNSWNGKFHLEMHLWHAGHFAPWSRPALLERSMGFYAKHLPEAQARARAHGVRGAWWPKMVGPEGRESPSTVNPFIMWQQPHPIYLAELLYRSTPTPATLERYRDVVLQTADLLASYPIHDEARDRFVIGPPIIPAQEVFPPLTTFNPTFELEYFRFGLTVAQAWRERLGLAREPAWDRVIAKLSPLPVKDGVYLATESTPELWTQARSPLCSGGRTDPACLNRDHPSFVAALGLLPGAGVNRETMRRTLEAVRRDWDLRQTWGWDFPMLAMTAARLGQREQAVAFLLDDAPNFRFGVAGMTPRVQSEQGVGAAGAEASRASRTLAETYFPSNGALLWAVALMAGGWDGAPGPHPGFPDDGRWVVRTEGLRPLP